jgi:large subunit ribosomal protein L33
LFYSIGFIMAKKENRFVVTLRSTESADTYTTSKNKKNTPGRLELKKYDPVLRRHVIYRESK